MNIETLGRTMVLGSEFMKCQMYTYARQNYWGDDTVGINYSHKGGV